ncbi:hypothetical protein CPC08DRAFT_699473 [Agrocybe pediades]|nr:hypothetical protein CPC08DRAFT_699473 [Agrocybe pediades]
MLEKRRRQDIEGLETVQTIAQKCLPQWHTGLRPVQLELVSGILDGDDVLCCAPTCDGRSCAFSVPPIVLREYNEHPGLYVAGLPTRKRPIAVENLVHELSLLGVSAFSYCSEALTEARKAGVRLASEIKECLSWQVIFVDPEHLTGKEWREIADSPTFRANGFAATVDEVHLINEWGLSFRLAFGTVWKFLRGRLLSCISIYGLSATLEPGDPTKHDCQSLASGRKAIIHCRSIEQVSHVFAHLWQLQPAGADKLSRVRIYHNICPPEYNQETVRLLNTDPQLQIVISTVAFSNGLNAKALLDSLSLGLGSTFNESWQEKGCAGRNQEYRFSQSGYHFCASRDHQRCKIISGIYSVSYLNVNGDHEQP